MNYISGKERRLFLAIASLILFFSIVSLVYYNVKADYERSEYFRLQEESIANGGISFAGPYCFPDPHPKFLLLIVTASGITLLLAYVSRGYFLNFLSASGLFALFINWFIKTSRIIAYDSEVDFEGLDKLFYKANAFDFVVFLLVLILFFWQFSILLRILIKTSQRKFELP